MIHEAHCFAADGSFVYDDMLLTLPAASASAHTFGDCDFDDPCNSGFVPRDFDEDDFGFVPINQGFFIDEDDLDDCDFVPGWGWMCD